MALGSSSFPVVSWHLQGWRDSVHWNGASVVRQSCPVCVLVFSRRITLLCLFGFRWISLTGFQCHNPRAIHSCGEIQAFRNVFFFFKCKVDFFVLLQKASAQDICIMSSPYVLNQYITNFTLIFFRIWPVRNWNCLFDNAQSHWPLLPECDGSLQARTATLLDPFYTKVQFFQGEG